MTVTLSLIDSFTFESGDGVAFDSATGNLFGLQTLTVDISTFTFDSDILQVTPSGEQISSFEFPNSPPLDASGATFLPNGNLLITSAIGGQVQEFTPSGETVAEGISLTVPGPADNVLLVSTVYDQETETVLGTNFFAPQILEFALDGTLVNTIDLSGSFADGSVLQGIEIDSATGNFLVADDSGGSSSIYEFTRAGALVSSTNLIDLTGSEQFADPEGLALDSATNTLYVVFDDDDDDPNRQGDNIAAFSLNTSSNVLFDTDIYRFQDDIVPGSYLFTGGSERDSINTDFADSFTEEGLAFTVASQPDDELIALYRFRSNQGTYLLVGDEERNAINTDANLSGEYTEEGLAFYVYGAGSGEGTEFNRLRNVNLPGAYIYATGDELANIRANFAETFVDEGVAFEALI